MHAPRHQRPFSMRYILFVPCLGCLSLAPVAVDAGVLQSASDPPRLKVLFLGDRGHHRPGDRAAQISPVMALRGIDVTYTERAADLNKENLRRYNALLIY